METMTRVITMSGLKDILCTVRRSIVRSDGFFNFGRHRAASVWYKSGGDQ